MTDVNVETTRTRFTMEQFLTAVISAWKNLFHHTPTKEQVGILWAQYALETGGGGYCWNFNIGNIKKIRNDKHSKYMMLAGTWEIINGKRVVFQPPSEVTWFRAYDTLQEGVTDYIRFLSSGRYKVAFQAALSGSPEEFAHRLKVAGYYTAPERDYVLAVRSRFNAFMKIKNIDSFFVEAAPEPTPEPVKPEPEYSEPPVTIEDFDIIHPLPDMTPPPLPEFKDEPLKLTPMQSIMNFFMQLFKTK